MEEGLVEDIQDKELFLRMKYIIIEDINITDT